MNLRLPAGMSSERFILERHELKVNEATQTAKMVRQ